MKTILITISAFIAMSCNGQNKYKEKVTVSSEYVSGNTLYYTKFRDSVKENETIIEPYTSESNREWEAFGINVYSEYNEAQNTGSRCVGFSMPATYVDNGEFRAYGYFPQYANEKTYKTGYIGNPKYFNIDTMKNEKVETIKKYIDFLRKNDVKVIYVDKNGMAGVPINNGQSDYYKYPRKKVEVYRNWDLDIIETVLSVYVNYVEKHLEYYGKKESDALEEIRDYIKNTEK